MKYRIKHRFQAHLTVLLFCLLLTGILFPFGAYAGLLQTTQDTGDTPSRVETILEEMSLREKITQMLMVEIRTWNGSNFTAMNTDVGDILADYQFGAMIYFAQNLVTTEQSFQLTRDVQAAAMSKGGLPMIICADQEGGSVYRLGTGTALPGNMALGAAGTTDHAKAAGRILGSELSALGINTNLAPVVDVNNNANNPVIGLRSYGDDAEAVGTLAAATIQGMAEYNVIGCAKHFPGHGDTATDSHYGLPIVDKSKRELLDNELKPYTVAIEEGIEMIMTAHILYPQLDSSTLYSNLTGKYESLPATMSQAIITGLLKEEMGFQGIVTTDAINMNAIAANWTQVQAVVNAIRAGVDMVCMPCTLSCASDLSTLESIIAGVETAVSNGTISQSRIDDAVTRILTVKENRTILDYDPSDYTLDRAKETVGSAVNRQSEREISAAAVTVVKNNDQALPVRLTSQSKVLMLCPYDNERAQLVMGWNRAIEAGLVPDGAVMDYYRFSSSTLTSSLKTKIKWADTVIVISEVSSASRMAYSHWLSAGPNNIVNYASDLGKTTIVMSADKPYDVQLYPNADAILAVYGCKGSSMDPTEALVGATTHTDAYGPNIIAGVEVILGVFGAQGTLPVDVPVFSSYQGSYTTSLAYPRGHGITYPALKHVKNLTVSGLASEYAYTGNPIQPQLTLQDTDQNITLTEGKDYSLSYAVNTQLGSGSITITGIGSYFGQRELTFTICPADISNAQVVLAPSAVTYNGSSFAPTLSVVLDGVDLSANNYTVAYLRADETQANELRDAGTYIVAVTGRGNYTGTVNATFVIHPPTIGLTASTEQTGDTCTLTATASIPSGRSGYVVILIAQYSQDNQMRALDFRPMDVSEPGDYSFDTTFPHHVGDTYRVMLFQQQTWVPLTTEVEP